MDLVATLAGLVMLLVGGYSIVAILWDDLT
jgi:hypothetical protein